MFAKMVWVYFTNNEVDATRIKGNYLSWQFPGGPLIEKPPAQITHHLSISVNKLHCYSNTGEEEYDYQGLEDLSYDNGERVEWTGE